MGQDRTDGYRISLCDGLGLHAARRGDGLQDGTAATISRLFPRPRRAENHKRLRARPAGNAEAAAEVARICPKPAADLSRHDALSSAAACLSLGLPARPDHGLSAVAAASRVD